jgi:hypothetical protein
VAARAVLVARGARGAARRPDRPTAALADLTRLDPGARRFLLVDAGRAVGAAVIRDPWLRGPYIELMALFAEAQGRGLGGAFVDWDRRAPGAPAPRRPP